LSGIYFHIPFCKQACYYCNFHFSTSLLHKNEMLTAMEKEIALKAEAVVNTEIINTIYFGGGTPSLLQSSEIKRLLDATKAAYNISSGTEITIEANPDDINENKLREWQIAGINRLSVGIQSFNIADLKWMNRAHTAEQALQCIQLIKESGYDNFSVDLIYGTPTLNDHDWKSNVEKIIALNVPHISCYALTVEPSTALHKMIAQKKKEDVDHEKQARHFLSLMNWMEAAGYEHYEISNFALPGYKSKHNSSYWQGKHYTGIGPSAHSYFGNTRRWNISNNALYIRSVNNGIVPFEEENLTRTQQLNEYIMTSLRTSEGLDLELIKEKFGEKNSFVLSEQSKKFIESERVFVSDQKIILTKEGKLFADGIAVDLFFTDIL
jgi:oxygen-independent coproporphyrinogen-3 oxidase